MPRATGRADHEQAADWYASSGSPALWQVQLCLRTGVPVPSITPVAGCDIRCLPQRDPLGSTAGAGFSASTGSRGSAAGAKVSRAATSSCSLSKISGLSAVQSVWSLPLQLDGPSIISLHTGVACSYAHQQAPERPWGCCWGNTPDACNCLLQRTREGSGDGKHTRTRSTVVENVSSSDKPCTERPSPHAQVGATSTPRHAYTRKGAIPYCSTSGPAAIGLLTFLRGHKGGPGGPVYLAACLPAHGVLHTGLEVRDPTAPQGVCMVRA